jgi:hypothetical protein
MSRSLALLLAPALAGGLALADGPAPEPAERAGQLRRDRRLVAALVEGGVQLAAQDDAVRRAAHCNRIAESVAAAIREAVQTNDRSRAGELGNHLRQLLTRGVANNLSTAHAALPADSPRHGEIRRALDDARAVSRPLRQKLNEIPQQDREGLTELHHALDAGHGALEKALPDEPDPPTQKYKSPAKAPPAGKKLTPKG